MTLEIKFRSYFFCQIEKRIWSTFFKIELGGGESYLNCVVFWFFCAFCNDNLELFCTQVNSSDPSAVPGVDITPRTGILLFRDQEVQNYLQLQIRADSVS